MKKTVYTAVKRVREYVAEYECSQYGVVGMTLPVIHRYSGGKLWYVSHTTLSYSVSLQ